MNHREHTEKKQRHTEHTEIFCCLKPNPYPQMILTQSHPDTIILPYGASKDHKDSLFCFLLNPKSQILNPNFTTEHRSKKYNMGGESVSIRGIFGGVGVVLDKQDKIWVWCGSVHSVSLWQGKLTGGRR
jgi:hypothetical protein